MLHVCMEILHNNNIIIIKFLSINSQHRPKARSLNKGTYNPDTGAVYLADNS